MHAGSDRARLMAHPEMGTAYCEMLRQAALVLTADDSLLGFGLDQAH